MLVLKWVDIKEYLDSYTCDYIMKLSDIKTWSPLYEEQNKFPELTEDECIMIHFSIEAFFVSLGKIVCITGIGH